MDYQFVAILMCAVLGWTLHQVLSLTWPQFEYISCQLCRLQYSRAKNEVFFGVAAALGGKENRKNLLDSAGDFFVAENERDLSYTQEELDAAMKRADQIAAANRAAAEKEDCHV